MAGLSNNGYGQGNVQMAGFRTFIKNVADSLTVKGFAENEKDGSVKVICEGEGEAIERLVNSVKPCNTVRGNDPKSTNTLTYLLTLSTYV